MKYAKALLNKRLLTAFGRGGHPSRSRDCARAKFLSWCNIRFRLAVGLIKYRSIVHERPLSPTLEMSR